MNFVRLMTWKMYFMRGHNQWLIFPMWLGNTVIIWYQLAFNQLDIFENIYMFALIFLSGYIPLATFAGRWEFRNESGGVPTEHKAQREMPIWKEVFREFDRLNTRFDKLEEELEGLK
ncbi:hypothetical protein LCGC14_1118270 [marine sediment metagenome]|uniref:Uncharacterized protein n=1 Tax=marine sediment metagenome TaxID=412755 RepID=A0A0F9MSN0_9ZZZZ